MLRSLSIAYCVILVVPPTELTEKCFLFCFGFGANWF